jgi:hypothetical protein
LNEFGEQAAVLGWTDLDLFYEDKLTFYRKPASERGPSVAVWEFGGRNG